MRRHIGEQTLARFGQGDLSAGRSARIRAHLAGCARCRGLNEDLAGVTTLLADAQPPPIPEHLSARIQTALAAEAAKRARLTAAAKTPAARTAGADAADTPAPRPGIRSPRPAHRQRQPRTFRLSSPVALRTMAAAAAAVVIAGGSYEIVAHVGGSAPSSGTASGSAPSGSSVTPHLAAPEAGPAAGPQLHYEYAGGQDSVNPVMSHTNYAAATLSGQVSQELSRSRATGQGGSIALHSNGSYAPASGSSRTFGDIPVARLQGCVSRLAAGQQVLLVDVARYQGTPATVIVTRASAAGPEQVWVVGTGCSDTGSDVLTHLTLAAAG